MSSNLVWAVSAPVILKSLYSGSLRIAELTEATLNNCEHVLRNVSREQVFVDPTFIEPRR